MKSIAIASLFTLFTLTFTHVASATGIAPLSDKVWVDNSQQFYYQVPVSIVPIGEDSTASVRIYEQFPYRKVVKINGEYLVSPLSKRNFDAVMIELTEHGKRIRGDFNGDGREDLIVQTDTGEEFIISDDKAKPFDINVDLAVIANMEVVDVNSDKKDDILDATNDKVQYATTDGFTAAIGTSEYVGTLSGQSNVSPNGDFSYSIPITTAESTGGLKPQVGLSYSSSPNNGHIGVGWGVSGMSTISRCEQNVETDGAVTKVDFTNTDRFCLDGQRLIVKNGQLYGANNTEYRTAQNSFQKIIAQTSSTALGPNGFVVTDTKGNTFYYGRYGSDTQALIKTPDGKHFAWALKRVKDASGNYYTYSYGKVIGSLEYYPTRISYSGHTAYAPKNRIDFSYGTRTDTSESYIAGYKTTVTKRLDTIYSYYDNQLLKKYNLKYRMDLSSFGSAASNLLISVEACDASNRCLSPTTFQWNARNLSGTSGFSEHTFSRNSRYKGHQMLDFNGDGLLDIAYVRNDRGSSTDHLFLIKNEGRSLNLIRTYNNFANRSFRRTWKVTDYDKDGKDDILYMSGGWKVLKYVSGTTFGVSSISGLAIPSSDANSRFVDMDADGLPDLMHIVNNNLKVHKGTSTGISTTQSPVQMALRNYSTGSSLRLLDYDKDDNTFASTDFNGDGRADFIVQVRETTYTQPPGPGPGPCIPRFRFDCEIDIRGAGDTDSANALNNSKDVINTLLPRKPSLSSPSDPVEVDGKPIVATDRNLLSASEVVLDNGAYLPSREGLDDKEYANLLSSLDIDAARGGTESSLGTTNTWRIVLSEPGSNNGFQLTEYTRLWSTSSIDKVQPMNINGDGLTDLVYRNSSNKYWYAVINNGNGFNAPIYLFSLDEDYLATLDVNADGAADILFKSGSSLYYRTYVNGTFANRYYGSESAGYNELNYADMDGDGVQDRFIFKGRSRTDFRTDTGANRITRVTDGFGANVNVYYSTLNDRNVYVKENDGRLKRWGNLSRVTDVNGAIPVVSSLSKGGDLLRYKYVGGKAQIGRGMLGYRQVIITSQSSSMRTTTTYRQDGIYRGSPSEVLVEAVVAQDPPPGPGPGPGPIDPCEVEPSLCQPCPPGGGPCFQPFSLNGVSAFGEKGEISASSTSYKRKNRVTYTYNVLSDTNFKISNKTTAQMVFPRVTVNETYNIDSSANELLFKKEQSVTLNEFGQALTETNKHLNDKYVQTVATTTNTYGTSVYGKRLTSSRQNVSRTNTYNGSNYVETPIQLTSTYTYDGLGRLVSTTADNGVKATNTINSFGLISRQTSSVAGLDSRIINTGFDSFGRHVVSKSNELGHITRMYYNNKGFKSYAISPNGQRTYYGYNGMGRQTNETQTPQNNTSVSGPNALSSSKVQYWCNSVAHCPAKAVYYEEISQEGKPSSRTYTDKLGNVVREAAQGLVAGTWIHKDYTFDAKNRKIAETVPYLSNTSNNLQTRITYDSQNRAVEIAKPDGGLWKTDYTGFTTTSIAPDNTRTTETKNGLGNLISVKDANSQTAWYLYNTTGNLRLVTDPVNNKISISFDKYGNKTRIVDPNAGTISYVYNKYHELIQQIDGNSHRVNYFFDKLGRTVREVRTRNNNVREHDFTTVYDAGAFAIGLQSSMRDAVTGHYVQQFYDTFSRVKEIKTSFPGYSYTQKKEYDNAGRLVKETDASGSAVKHVYNTQNWAYQIRDAVTNALYWQANTIDSYGNINSDRFGSNINRSMIFDGETGLLSRVTSRVGSSYLQNLEYDWDNKGNLNYRRDLSKGLREDFAYDALNRFTQSRVSGSVSVTTNIAYNSIGNITSKSGVGTYAYHASKPHAVKSVRGERSNDYVYDAGGNITSDNQRTFVNNTFNKPITISKSGYYVDFTYGVGGQRFKRIETNYSQSSQSKHTHYVGNVEFVKVPNSSVWIAKRYISDKILITKVNSTQTVRYLLSDHLGSTHVIVKSNGLKEQEMSFDAFGARRNATTWAREHAKIPQFTSNITLRGYTGHEQLDELSLVHMGGRIYDPILGRFLQADPAIQQPNNIQSFNRYSYVLNNPLNKTDPSGYIWTALITYALKSIAANMAGTMLATAINVALTAYQFYGYYQLATGILNAIDGGGTAMANFVGGFAKGFVKGLAENLIIVSLAGRVGGTDTELGNADANTVKSESAELAEMASCAYSVDCPGTNSGWNKVTPDGFSESDFINADTGFKSALFQKGDRYVLAFAGTDGLSDWGDIKANITQALGMDTKQYNQAIGLATKLSDALGAENLVITGHSLGGGLASAASLATGIRAETFNAAGLNSSTAKQYKLDMKKAETLITAHYTMNDELSYLQDANFYQVGLWSMLPSAAGRRNMIGDGTHGIGDACIALSAKC
jgi:RHS repeat-associated protein